MLGKNERMRWFEIASVVLGTAATFGVINVIHFQYFEIEVILYACLLDALLACAVFFFAYQLIWRGRSTISNAEKALSLTTSFLMLTVYSVMGPTVVDRSLSLYIVEKLNSRGGEIALDSLPDIFIYEYMPEYRLMDVRLTEQVASGTAVIENGCVRLTPRGRLVATLSNLYRRIFMPRRRVLLNNVTDALVDPLRNSKPIVDTKCYPS